MAETADIANRFLEMVVKYRALALRAEQAFQMDDADRIHLVNEILNAGLELDRLSDEFEESVSA